MAESMKMELLAKLVEASDKILLVNKEEDFQVDLCTTAAKHFSPVLKKQIAKLKSEDNEVKGTLEINVAGFSFETVKVFVEYLHGNGVNVLLDWQELVPLLKMSQTFMVQKLIRVLYGLALPLISKENLYEAIVLIDKFEINEWLEPCCQVLKNCDQCVMKSESWNKLVEENSKAVAKLLNLYVCRKRDDQPKINFQFPMDAKEMSSIASDDTKSPEKSEESEGAKAVKIGDLKKPKVSGGGLFGNARPVSNCFGSSGLNPHPFGP